MWKSYVQSLAHRLGYEIRRWPVAPSVLTSFEVQHRLLTRRGLTAPVVFDVGANLGQTADAYRAQFPEARIFCFEPNPDLVARLRHKFQNDPLITVLPYAVSDRAGLRTFHITARDDQNSLLPRPSIGRRYFPSNARPKRTIDVQSVTLDDVIRAGEAPAPDVLKFDIQGAELLALQGAVSLMRSQHVQLIYSEVWFTAQYEGSALLRDLWPVLSGFGYSFYSVHNFGSAANGQLRLADAIFVSDALRAAALDTFPDEP